MQSKSKLALSVSLLFGSALGCSSDGGSSVPWSGQRTMVIDASRMAVEVAPVSGSGCLKYRDECLKPNERCGKEGADIVLDANGHLLDYVCYPGEATLSVEEIAAHHGDVAQKQNNAVIVLDALDDGADIEGSISIDANNVVVYGEDPRHAVISGSVTLDGNNIVVRGVRIQGDLIISKNNVTVALAAVGGDLIVHGNNVQVLATDVLGTITVTGNNVKLLGNHVAGTLTVSGNGADCRDNHGGDDTDGDGELEATELNGALTCG